MTIKSTLKKAYRILKNNGKDALIQKVKEHTQKIDVISFYDYIVDEDVINLEQDMIREVDKDKMIINWIIPEMGIGSGGHINIFRFVSDLQRKGHINRIYLFKSNGFKDNVHLKKFLMEHYPTLDSTVEVHWTTDEITYADATFATSWQTAYFVRKFNNTRHKFYFVQDFEPYFYAHGSDYVFAEATYSFGFTGITAGGWLKDKLEKEYNMKCYDFGFSYDKYLYKPSPKRDNKKRILFYARPVTPRRDFEIGLLAINELSKKIPDIQVIFAGWDVSNYKIPFEHLNAGSVALNELPDLYSQCDICIALSNTNLSLLPLEVMACKSVIMSNYGEHVKWLLNKENSILVDLDPNDIANKLYNYLNDKLELNRIRQNGYEFAITTDWKKEGDKVEQYILKELLGNER